MKLTILSLLFITAALSSHAQKQANIWYFGFQVGIDFNSGSPISLNNSAMGTNEGCASIADKTTGQILFYTDGTTIYNNINDTMFNGKGMLGNSSSTQSAVIVPQPGSATLFYVFTADEQVGYYTGNHGDLCYNIVDMSQNGGLGAVTVKNYVLSDSMTEKIAAYPACNGQGIWIVAHHWNSNAFYSYLVTSAGVSGPVISNAGTVHQSGGTIPNSGAIGYMKISPDGSMIAVACDYFLQIAEVLTFDNSTGIIGAPLLTDNTWPIAPVNGGPYGITFSPDNTLLYVGQDYGSAMYQYNLKAGNSAAILASKLLVASNPIANFGALQIAPNGKIYIAEAGLTRVAVLNDPNTLGSGCNYKDSAVMLSGRCAWGLPDMVETFLLPPYTATLSYPGCSGNTAVPFTDSTLNGAITCHWDFGDPASGASDSSTLQNPTHAFSFSGSDTIKLYLNNQCGTDTLIRILNVSSGTNAAASPADTSFCAGSFVQLQASGGTTYKWLPVNGLSNPNIANPIDTPSISTTYTVTVSPSPCGDSTATVAVIVFPAPPTPTISQSYDTLFCSTDTSYISYQWYSNDTLIAGDTNVFYVVTKAGNYNVAVTNRYGCVISVGINTTVGLQNYFSDHLISLWPNPALSEITLHSSSSLFEAATVSIKNVLGQETLLPTSLKGKGEDALIDIGNLAPGIYFLQVVGEKGRWMGRFVKD